MKQLCVNNPMKIYLSGAITSCMDTYKETFGLVAVIARQAGYDVFNPAEQFDGRTDLPREAYMRWDIENLLQCDAIWMLDNWQWSEGAKLEHSIAQQCNIPVFYLGNSELTTCGDRRLPLWEEPYGLIAELLHLPQLIGVTGYAGTGKDTAAKLLKPYGFQRVAFADALREDILLNPKTRSRQIPYYGTGCQYQLHEIVSMFGWERAKRMFPEVRFALQEFGSIMRGLHPDYWIGAANITGRLSARQSVVVTDVRYENEIEFIRSLDGVILELQRPGCAPVNAHPSETEWNGKADAVIQNDATPDALLARILIALINHETQKSHAPQP